MSKTIKDDPIAHVRKERAAFERADAQLNQIHRQLADAEMRRKLAGRAAETIVREYDTAKADCKRLSAMEVKARIARTRQFNQLLAKAARRK
jgi:hypothetical protein